MDHYIKTCPTCEGEGHIKNDTLPAYLSFQKEGSELLHSLEFTQSVYSESTEQKVCSQCNGLGQTF